MTFANRHRMPQPDSTPHNFDIFDPERSNSTSPGLGDREILSVTDLTKCVRAILEAEDLFRDVWVRGEVSNLVKHASGHVYFCLKDESALVRCVMWSRSARAIHFDLTDGMSVIIHGRISVYEKQGQYQLVLTEVMPDGVGALYVAYEQLKAGLQEEGLFDEVHKKEIPRFPRRIAIITSPTAAALKDMVTVARRRFRAVNLILIPTQMQGAGSEADVVKSLRLADSLPAVDAIIVGRGGGSIEDLWTFNTESVARAIFACQTPVVSAIGHETDYTLADFVADLRAPTPSAAAELVVPDSKELAARVTDLANAASATLRASLAERRNQLDALLKSRCFVSPEEIVQGRWQTVDLLTGRLATSAHMLISQYESRLGTASAKLDALSPLRVLARGYSIVRRSADKVVVKDVSDVEVGDLTETLLSNGRLISEVKDAMEGRD